MIVNISDALAHYPSNASVDDQYQRLLANILPMNKIKLNEFWDDFEKDPSVFEYSFDSIRYPLYFAQQCLVDYQSPICQVSLPNLTAMVKAAWQYSKTLNYNNKGKMPSMGFWSYDVSHLHMGYDATQYCFIERFIIDGVTYARVIFSSKTAPHKRSDINAGKMPTVSEGMAYGLLISCLANDQVLFDQLLRYVLAVSKNHGCALYYDHTCHQKSDLLMPWTTDIEGKPFYYKDEDGTSTLTNDSASDADVNIAWAVALAAQNVLDGKWVSSLFIYREESLTYWQLVKYMKQQILQFDGYQHARFFEKTYNWFMTPGNQWGASGEEVLYPGYFMPQAFLTLSSPVKLIVT
ncbi:glycosyl hydrolase family 8 [Cysteiniphilum sp. QT6929]|uniref:glycosyl hydrolase family 8 n=1 Tax=Cysteiniphilum sp. QT6929 TaxID=2975055 RepID=UPI0024B345A6|nr:glycosyl hydrolase family 8 [Cysteiniphilum sp. QT6929]WHN66386.1 glycosyl hydrolase family 8 [Cysteiniphilum sp. QT6929]